MATSGNLPSAAFEGGHFERGLTVEDAERFAASFKPSWEFDEAPFTAGVGGHAMSANDVDLLSAGGISPEIRRNYDSGRAQAAAPHVPAPRVESHEPEDSVIIDRTITAAEMERAAQNGHGAQANGRIEPSFPVVLSAQTQSAPPPPYAAPVLAAPVLTAPVLTAPVLSPVSPSGRPPPPAPMKASSRPPPPKVVAAPLAAKAAAPAYSPNDSLEIEVRKSNKPLFLGIGAAVALALAVLGVRAATTSSDAESGTPSTTAPGNANGASVANTAANEARIPPPPAAAAVTSPPSSPVSGSGASTALATAAPVSPATPSIPAAPAAAAITHAPAHAAPVHAAPPPAPRPAPRPAAPHAPAAPKSPTKPASGGIVRDVPF